METILLLDRKGFTKQIRVSDRIYEYCIPVPVSMGYNLYNGATPITIPPEVIRFAWRGQFTREFNGIKFRIFEEY